MENQIILTLYRYNRYANRRLMDKATGLTSDELARESSPSHGSIWGLLRHTFAVEFAYLRFAQAQAVQIPETGNLVDLRREWENLAPQAEGFIESLDGEQLETVMQIEMRRKPLYLPVWQLLLQAVMHSHHHRGELSILFTTLGYPLDTCDIVVYMVEASGQEWPFHSG
jgi:uncharacterized damage-inducible protein DinB